MSSARQSLLARSATRGFTLIEMLIVIAVIVILAGLLLSAIHSARIKARETKCKANLRQFFTAIEMYRNNYDAKFEPPWLSVLAMPPESYICPSDSFGGKQGSRPDWFGQPPHEGLKPFTETDDTDQCQAAPEIRELRNKKITACSYLYEFCWAECSWWKESYGSNYEPTGEPFGDFDGNGWVSWREAKRCQEKGWVWDGTKGVNNPDKAYGDRVPIVRCFWHVRKVKPEAIFTEKVFNASCGAGDVFESDIFSWEKALEN